jgi:hypothetical protein
MDTDALELVIKDALEPAGVDVFGVSKPKIVYNMPFARRAGCSFFLYTEPQG